MVRFITLKDNGELFRNYKGDFAIMGADGNGIEYFHFNTREELLDMKNGNYENYYIGSSHCNTVKEFFNRYSEIAVWEEDDMLFTIDLFEEDFINTISDLLSYIDEKIFEEDY